MTVLPNQVHNTLKTLLCFTLVNIIEDKSNKPSDGVECTPLRSVLLLSAFPRVPQPENQEILRHI